jgi:hypothetical protein
MIEHLKKYIGLYLLGMIALAIYFDAADDSYPVWVWWLLIPVVLWKTPPFNIGDWFWGKVAGFWVWVLTALINQLKKLPWWARTIFAVVLLYCFEQYFLAPLGYTMLPWRMDFS